MNKRISQNILTILFVIIGFLVVYYVLAFYCSLPGGKELYASDNIQYLGMSQEIRQYNIDNGLPTKLDSFLNSADFGFILIAFTTGFIAFIDYLLSKIKNYRGFTKSIVG